MDITQQELKELRTSVRRQRWSIVGLWVAVASGFLLAASRPAANATFDKIVCKQLAIVDDQATERVLASTTSDGRASVKWRDPSGKIRIDASTSVNAGANIMFADQEERLRIVAGTTSRSGVAGMSWFDQLGKLRISAMTLPDGRAGVEWYAQDGSKRIEAATVGDGAVIFPAPSSAASSSSPPTRSSDPVPPSKPQNRSGWLKMKTQLTESQVRSMLGEPDSVVTAGSPGFTGVQWIYGGDGSVLFLNGKVTNWTKPRGL